MAMANSGHQIRWGRFSNLGRVDYDGFLPFFDGRITIYHDTGMAWEGYATIAYDYNKRPVCTAMVSGTTPEAVAESVRKDVLAALSKGGLTVDWTNWVPDFTKVR